MPDFLSLPRETRNNIYYFALVRPYDLIPEPTDWQRKERQQFLEKTASDGPYMALLATCKLVNAEGTPVFFNRNRFRLPYHQMSVIGLKMGKHFVENQDQIRHIFVAFDGRDLPAQRQKTIASRFQVPRGGETVHERSERIRRHLSTGVLELKALWVCVGRWFAKPATLPALKTVIIDLSQIACPLAVKHYDCRKRLLFEKHFDRDLMINWKRPQDHVGGWPTVRVTGFANKEERDHFLLEYGFEEMVGPDKR